MTCGKKEFLKYSVLQGNTSFAEVSCECVMVARLKEIYRANIIASSIFLVGGTQAPILHATYHKRSP